MHVDDKEMLIVQGRLIAPPEIKYISGRDGQSEVVERINIGKSVNNILEILEIVSYLCKVEYP